MTEDRVEDGITGLTYEAALAELDILITKLEGGSIALEEAIGAYERGVVLAQYCAELLERTEQRVNQLVVSASGAMSERPLEAFGAPPPEPAAAAPRPELARPSVAPTPARPAAPRIDPDDVPF
jgi:exodeoxyribonuclease VII small subunit